jgi:Coenzyme PQQ synthesis protein D (PqqD)
MVQFVDRVVVPEHVLVRHLDEEAVLLNLDTEKYFGLDAMGSRMFVLVTGSPCVEMAYEQLLEEFDVEPEVLRSHLADLLSLLVNNGLLDVRPADVESTSAV